MAENDGSEFKYIYANTKEYPFGRNENSPEVIAFINYLKGKPIDEKTPDERKCYESYLKYSKEKGEDPEKGGDPDDEKNNATDFDEKTLDYKRLTNPADVAFAFGNPMNFLSMAYQNCKKFINSKVNKYGIVAGFAAVYSEAQKHVDEQAQKDKDANDKKNKTPEEETPEENVEEKPEENVEETPANGDDLYNTMKDENIKEGKPVLVAIIDRNEEEKQKDKELHTEKQNENSDNPEQTGEKKQEDNELE